MDARDKWLKQAMQLATIFLFEGRRNDDATPMLKQAGDNLQAHLRTTPEGFALVPVEPTEDAIRVLVDNETPYMLREHFGEKWRLEIIKQLSDDWREVVSDEREFIAGFWDCEEARRTYDKLCANWRYEQIIKAPPPKSEPL